MIHKCFYICLLIVVSLGSHFIGFAQNSDDDKIQSEVSRVYPPISLTPEQALGVETLMDISPFYKPSWVKEYISIEIKTIVDGKPSIGSSKSHTLTESQIELINLSDEGTEIWATTTYIPDNTLSHNDVKEHSFVFTIDPATDAHYIKGYSSLEEQLQTNIIDHLDPAVFEGFALAAITFTVDKEGHIRDAQVSESSEDEVTDKILLDAICKMTGWSPATYASGLRTEQEFVWIVGNRKSCKMNFFNTRRDLAELGN